jgi:hypothetical protein
MLTVFCFCLRQADKAAGTELTQIEAAEDIVTICNAIDSEEQAAREELEVNIKLYYSASHLL